MNNDIGATAYKGRFGARRAVRLGQAPRVEKI